MFEFLLIHQRLNHIAFQTLKDLILQEKLKGYRGNIKLVDPKLLPKCKICGIWKMHAVTQHSINPNVRDQRPGARFDCDTKSFSQVLNGHVNTVAIFVDAYSKKSYSYWLFYPTEASPNVFLHKVFKQPTN